MIKAERLRRFADFDWSTLVAPVLPAQQPTYTKQDALDTMRIYDLLRNPSDEDTIMALWCNKDRSK